MRTFIHFFTKRSFRFRQKTYKSLLQLWNLKKTTCLILKMLCWLKMQVWFFPGQTNCYQSFEMLVISPFILIPKTHCVVLLLYALTKRRQTKAKKIGLPFKCKQNKAIHFLDISRWLCPMVLNDRFSQLLISFTVRNTCWVVSILIVLPILTAQFQHPKQAWFCLYTK